MIEQPERPGTVLAVSPPATVGALGSAVVAFLLVCRAAAGQSYA
jgi:hypothetical protein